MLRRSISDAPLSLFLSETVSVFGSLVLFLCKSVEFDMEIVRVVILMHSLMHYRKYNSKEKVQF